MFIWALVASQDGRLAAVATDNHVEILSPTDATYHKRFTFPGRVSAIAWNASVETLWVCCAPSAKTLDADQLYLLTLNSAKSELLKVFESPQEEHDLRWSPDGKIMAVATGEGAKLYSSPDLQFIGELKGHGIAVVAMEFSPDNKWLATGGNDNRVIVWDLATKRALGNVAVPRKTMDRPYRFGWSKDSTTLFGVGGTTAYSWDRTLKEKSKVDLVERRESFLMAPDGTKIELSSGTKFAIESSAFSTDGAEVAYAHDDLVTIKEMSTGKIVGEWPKKDRIDALTFLKGRVLVSGQRMTPQGKVRFYQFKK
jgi:WD40 repeat protein